jgi:hypothetical protein
MWNCIDVRFHPHVMRGMEWNDPILLYRHQILSSYNSESNTAIYRDDSCCFLPTHQLNTWKETEMTWTSRVSSTFFPCRGSFPQPAHSTQLSRSATLHQHILATFKKISIFRRIFAATRVHRAGIASPGQKVRQKGRAPSADLHNSTAHSTLLSCFPTF